MKTLAILSMAALAGLMVSCKSNPDSQKKETIAQSYKVIIDARSDEEFAAGHLKGAINIPYTEIEQKVGEAVPDKAMPVAVYCRSGRRSGIARDTMLTLGYQHVDNIGGIEEAAQKVVLPIVK